MGAICCGDNDDNIVNNDNMERALSLPFKCNFRQGTLRDRIYGSILGSLLGSAYGAPSDNSESQISQSKVNKLMDMPSGGYHGTAAGQITESGELTMCLLRAIVEANSHHIIHAQINTTGNEAPETVLNTDKIANQYRKWFVSEPFEIDEALYKSVSPLLENPKAIIAKNATLNANRDNLSSSSLSRLTPIAVWASSLRNEEEFKKAIEAEVTLTHCNQLVLDAAYIYCLTIQHLLNHHDDNNRANVAFEYAMKVASNQKLVESQEILAALMQAQQLCDEMQKQSGMLSPESERRETEVNTKIQRKNTPPINFDFLPNNYDALKKVNSVKHGIVLSFFFLCQAQVQPHTSEFFEQAISQTLRLGGKTSANAAIVGGMLGALIGAKSLPLKNLNKLFRYDCTSNYFHGPQKRPSFLSVNLHVVQLIDQLIECRPIKSLEIIEQQESDKIDKKNPQENTNSSENSPITIEDKPEDPYNQMIVDMIKGNLKIEYQDFLKKLRLKYPKNVKGLGKVSSQGDHSIKKY